MVRPQDVYTCSFSAQVTKLANVYCIERCVINTMCPPIHAHECRILQACHVSVYRLTVLYVGAERERVKQ